MTDVNCNLDGRLLFLSMGTDLRLSCATDRSSVSEWGMSVWAEEAGSVSLYRSGSLIYYWRDDNYCRLMNCRVSVHNPQNLTTRPPSRHLSSFSLPLNCFPLSIVLFSLFSPYSLFLSIPLHLLFLYIFPIRLSFFTPLSSLSLYPTFSCAALLWELCHYPLLLQISPASRPSLSYSSQPSANINLSTNQVLARPFLTWLNKIRSILKCRITYLELYNSYSFISIEFLIQLDWQWPALLLFCTQVAHIFHYIS